MNFIWRTQSVIACSLLTVYFPIVLMTFFFPIVEKDVLKIWLCSPKKGRTTSCIRVCSKRALYTWLLTIQTCFIGFIDIPHCWEHDRFQSERRNITDVPWWYWFLEWQDLRGKVSSHGGWGSLNNLFGYFFISLRCQVTRKNVGNKLVAC